MNTRVAIVATLLVLCARSSFGQTGDSALAFYPMKTGNLWQFRCQSRIWPNPYAFLCYYTLAFEGDTLMPNGKSYQVQVSRRQGSVSYSYLRMDSAKGNVLQYLPGQAGEEIVVDSLRASPGNAFGAYGCVSFIPNTVLGIPTVAKTFVSSSSGNQNTLSMGVGPTGFLELFGDEGSYLSDLVYTRINGVEHGVLASAPTGATGYPRSYDLLQNFPNPFNPTTTIRYALPQRSHATLTVYNMLGQIVATLVNGEVEAGSHEVAFDGTGSASGVYFYRLSAGEYVVTKSLILLK